MVKKGDIIVIIVSLVLLVLCIGFCLLIKKDGIYVVIKEDNKTVYSGSLFKDDTIKLKHNTVKIKNGQAYMLCADCKNQICVNTGKISNSGETIVCLPNKVIVEIE